MRQVKQKPDPAPSRLWYRYERMMLTPAFRFGLRVLMPFAIAAGATYLYFSDQDRVDQFNMALNDLRSAIVDRPEFMVKAMAIDGASPAVAEDIRDVLPIDFPISSFDLDLKNMKKTVSGLSPVKQAALRIRPGGVLQVHIAEREPVLVWRTRDGLHLVDAEGFVVAEAQGRLEHGKLPLMAGEGADQNAAEALLLVAAAGPLQARLRGLVRIGERRWNVMLDRDQTILLPEVGAVQALERVVAMSEVEDMLDRDLTQVDMRLAQRPTIRIAERSVEAWWQIRQTNVGANN